MASFEHNRGSVEVLDFGNWLLRKSLPVNDYFISSILSPTILLGLNGLKVTSRGRKRSKTGMVGTMRFDCNLENPVQLRSQYFFKGVLFPFLTNSHQNFAFRE